MREERIVKFGISVPIFGDYAPARVLAELAREAEQAGWDGFFVWDHMQQFEPAAPAPFGDAWISLAAIAMATERIRLGPMVTPLARRRPWKVAREAVALDHLSNGRLILGVGLGYPPDGDFGAFGEETDDRVRAAKLDEALEVVTGLWSGEPFALSGAHYRIKQTTFLPKPVQPRIPIWVAGYWPSRAPFRRAARWDGVAPGSRNVTFGETIPPEELRELLAYIHEYRERTEPFDVAVGGYTPGDNLERARYQLDPYLAAGVTWWLEGIDGFRGPFDAMRERVRQGPPRGG
jgi:alkanesulfonate monooxygenase SsuD/methylene tetrahydromethanopterin reductase-like flavin-dependent oxidoreductase (luciferase family)